ncbi:MAG: SIS domain-containing protein [Actinobacteria bacterium]|uniref:glutamine--fructose-6-phosphate transaminase (isomerizing) n=1 Tax=freshwater metagenome TaxID=449393 RepID=A0A6J6VS76_9ZZZZ|nr:SIS domain-containing protein [Actinomycetota bacterium]
MCGIVALLSRPSQRPAPTRDWLFSRLDAALADRQGGPAAVAGPLEEVDAALKGLPGVRALVGHPEIAAGITARLDLIDAAIAEFERNLETGTSQSPEEIEASNAAIIRLRDAAWAVRNDRLRTASAVEALAGRDAGVAALQGYLLVQQALSVLDRLEVRGRDSAGLHLFVWGHGLDTNDPAVRALIEQRTGDPLFTSGSVRLAGETLSVVYKAAAEIGELGDNTRTIRQAIDNDALLRLALSSPDCSVAVLGHTRWASVGIISEPNAHPLNHEEEGQSAGALPYVVAVLNGDVDNHIDLVVEHGLRIPGPITTDAKVIPALVSRHTVDTGNLVEGFRRTVASFEGSVAIGAASADAPNRVLLALRGSGQGVYVGLADDTFVVASEPYGIVEETARFVRLDGESPAHADQPASRGQILVLDGARAGDLAGLRRIAYDGSELPIAESEIAIAEVTTRDIDRGAYPHFLLKEISEAPLSFRKTLRGKIVEHDGLLRAALGARTIPQSVVDGLRSGRIRSVRVIGQGTAAVAGQSAAVLLDELVESRLDVRAITATELSGFHLAVDMSDMLVIAVSQSGTTTDTNRTVDLVRGRGATVIGIVNRRNSDLTDKADGVLYTSDGRDVEMSVASTKAFYAQVAAGALLACAISDLAGAGSDRRRHEILTELRRMPDAMDTVLERRQDIAEAAQRFAPQRRYWAVVGNGPNKVAAEEVRVKLSELCYKSIACDVTEDKKHIDLSSEPLIFVCAAGLVGSTADDVAKEVAIYRAHKAAPIVVASEGETRFNGALHLVTVPVVDPALAFILSAMVGHLFGYEAALAIDALARPLREAREVIEDAIASGVTGDQMLRSVSRQIVPMAQRFFDTLRTGSYDGNLEASTAVRLSGLLRDSLSPQPLEAYQEDSGKVGSPSGLIDDLTAALTRAIEELTRPVDAIKHQAKTVTVGISRSDEAVLDRSLVREVLATGAGRDRLAYRTLKVLGALDGAVAAVTGFTRYQVEGDPSADATITVVDRGGVSLSLPSRVEQNSSLRGTKRRVAAEREVLVARGRSDGRHVILVPEVKGSQTTGITLLHVRFHEHLPVATIRTVLQGYDRRYDRLVDWVTETEGSFRDDLLIDVPVVDLLVAPISEVADRWRSQA